MKIVINHINNMLEVHRESRRNVTISQEIFYAELKN